MPSSHLTGRDSLPCKLPTHGAGGGSEGPDRGLEPISAMLVWREVDLLPEIKGESLKNMRESQEAIVPSKGEVFSVDFRYTVRTEQRSKGLDGSSEKRGMDFRVIPTAWIFWTMS